MTTNAPIKLSRRIGNVQPSATLAVAAKAKALKAEGRDIIEFGAGEPDFDTPDHIKQAAIRALQAGQTKYTAAAGSPELRKAIVEKLRRDNGLEYKPEQVIVNVGAKHTLYAAMMVLVDEGDEVIIPAPYWVSYLEMVNVCGGKPVIVSAGADQDFKITPEQLRAAMSPKTVAVVLNSPSNPTGMVYTPAELRALAEVAVEGGATILSDEIYEKLLYDDAEFASVAGFSKEIYDRTLTINGHSKVFCMTGWRLGYAAGPLPVIKAMETLQSHSTSNPTSFAMAGGVEALRAGYDFLPPLLTAFDRRRRLLVDGLNAIDGIVCPVPKGAFYVFPDCAGLLGRKSPDGKVVATADQLAGYLLESVGVAVVPGEGFGAPTCVRLSYATSDEIIRKGIERIAQAAAALKA